MQLRDLLIGIAAECEDLEVSTNAQGQIRSQLRSLVKRVISPKPPKPKPSKPFRSALPLPPIGELRKRYFLDSVTGDVLMRLRGGGFKIAGERHHESGYVRLDIKIGGKRYRCVGHRVAWLLHYGEPPPLSMMVDHIDGNRKNNAINNLRLANPKENAAFFTERTGIVRLPPWCRRINAEKLGLTPRRT